MDSQNEDAVGRLLAAFATALEARDHEALDVQLAPWITVAEALELAGGNEFDVFVDDKLFPEVADRLPARVDERDYVAFARLGDLDAVVVEIAGGLYIGYLGRG